MWFVVQCRLYLKNNATRLLFTAVVGAVEIKLYHTGGRILEMPRASPLLWLWVAAAEMDHHSWLRNDREYFRQCKSSGCRSVERYGSFSWCSRRTHRPASSRFLHTTEAGGTSLTEVTKQLEWIQGTNKYTSDVGTVWIMRWELLVS